MNACINLLSQRLLTPAIDKRKPGFVQAHHGRTGRTLSGKGVAPLKLIFAVVLTKAESRGNCNCSGWKCVGLYPCSCRL